MNEPEKTPPPAETLSSLAVRRSHQALRLACGDLPHLSGLARVVRVKADSRVSVAAVAASGLLLVNPHVFATAPMADAAYVLAHELLHLALDTHNRVGDAPRLLGNYAHDYIINDILSEEMQRRPPLDGLEMKGARKRSLEQLMVDLSSGGDSPNLRCWRRESAGGVQSPRSGSQARSDISKALDEAGLLPPDESQPFPDDELPPGDLIDADQESTFEPDVTPEQRQRRQEQVRKAAAKAAALGVMKQQMAEAGDSQEPQRGDAMMRAVREAYHTPWQLALQRWFDAVAPGERTYARPSRRSGDRVDVVLPGRRREGWVLHVVLDTSGSMVDCLPRALGAIAGFCETSGVAQVRLLQCDQVVTHDDWVEPEQLDEYKITGFGYSDMSPALLRLAEDPEVTAAVVLTDGYIDIPSAEPPYRTLFVLLGDYKRDYEPAYGEVVLLDG